jgi:hypothetical protein
MGTVAMLWKVLKRIASRSHEVQTSRMQHEIQILSAKRQEETRAFAKTMLARIEANQLGSDAIELLADILSRRERQVSSQEVAGTLRCLLNNPDYLRPHFDTLESEWLYEKQSAAIVQGTPPA